MRDILTKYSRIKRRSAESEKEFTFTFVGLPTTK